MTKTIWAMYRKRDNLFKKQRPSKHSKDIISLHIKKYTSIKLGYRGRSSKHIGALLSGLVTWIAKGKIQRLWSFLKSLQKDDSEVASLKDPGKMATHQADKSFFLKKRIQLVFTKKENTAVGSAFCV